MAWMQTLNGTPFDLLEPSPAHVDFEEIAHALSLLCRFAGHTKTHYSVAEHSCRVADILPSPIKAYGLLHDAHEAYIGDITLPVAHALGDRFRADLSRLKDRVQIAVLEAAGLDIDPHESIAGAVKYADNLLLVTERRDLMAQPQKSWGRYEKLVPLAEYIEPWSAERAQNEFLRRLRAYGLTFRDKPPKA